MHQFNNFPTSRDISEYEWQTERFLFEVERIFNGDNFSLYSIGEIDLPGVSDIDFVIIGGNDLQKREITSVLGKYNLIDEPIFLSRADISMLSYMSHHNTFSYVGGEAIDLSFLEKRGKDLQGIYAWKVLFFSALRNLYSPYFTTSISVKDLLVHIYDLRYPIQFLRMITPGSFDSEIEIFISEYKQFRDSWFLHEDVDTLHSFLTRSIGVAWKLIQIFDTAFPVSVQSSVGPLYGRFPTIFESHTDFDIYRQRTEWYFQKISKKDRFLALPISMNYRLWSHEMFLELEKIKQINPNFLPFGFSPWYLQLILQFKKFVDMFKIYRFQKHAKT